MPKWKLWEVQQQAQWLWSRNLLLSFIPLKDQLQRILAGKLVWKCTVLIIIKINVLIFFCWDYFEWIQDDSQVKSDLPHKKKDVIRLTTCTHAHGQVNLTVFTWNTLIRAWKALQFFILQLWNSLYVSNVCNCIAMTCLNLQILRVVYWYLTNTFPNAIILLFDFDRKLGQNNWIQAWSISWSWSHVWHVLR